MNFFTFEIIAGFLLSHVVPSVKNIQTTEHLSHTEEKINNQLRNKSRLQTPIFNRKMEKQHDLFFTTVDCLNGKQSESRESEKSRNEMRKDRFSTSNVI